MEMAEYRAKRNDLGEVFGTRKAKSQIRAAERGKVNAAAMEGVRDHLMESIPVTEVIEGMSCFPSSVQPIRIALICLQKRRDLVISYRRQMSPRAT
jgi:hypothetical protein